MLNYLHVYKYDMDYYAQIVYFSSSRLYPTDFSTTQSFYLSM